MTDPDRLYLDVRYEIKDLKTAMLIGTYSSSSFKGECLEHLKELASLAATFGFQIAASHPCLVRKIDAGTYLGSGKIQELAIASEGIDVVIFDDVISPNQQRSLEKYFEKPVIDRTELILEVFAQRAQTREARLQIELAKTRYQLPRLKRLWTHLSRQSAGGGAYLKGEGEKQIELDRRMLKKRLHILEKELKTVRKNRATQRSGRLRTGIPTVAIVGYTNAGKSTLFNQMTQSDVLAEDKLFATLDTTTRRHRLPNCQEMLLIDTVGFIRKTPTTLIAAFKSTLEESLYTDVLLHVVDSSHPNALSQAQETLKIIQELGIKDKPIITVLNKIDACENLMQLKLQYPHTVCISALTKEGLDNLEEKIMETLKSLRVVHRLRIPQSHYELVSEIMQEGRVISCDYDQNDVLLHVEIPYRLGHKIKEFIDGA